MRITHFISALILGSSLLSIQAQTSSKYTIVNKIKLESDEKWDYLYSDDQANRLYVSHGSIVQVVDEIKGEMAGKIGGLNGVHGIAVASDLNKGFISSGKDSSVTIFDTKTLQVITKVTVGKGPDAIMFDPFSKKVFVFNAKANSASILNAETNKVEATIALSGNPEFSVSDGKGKVYVNLENASSIAVINSSTFTVENVWPLSPGEEPTGLALDNENHRLFSVCANKLMVVVDAETGKVLNTLPIGSKADGASFDPDSKCAYSSNGEGTLTVVQEINKDLFKVLENVPTQKGAKTIVVNKRTHHIYLPTASFETQQAGEKPKVVPGTFVILDIMLQ
jgi:YVTN family beta-propeller protein